MLYSSSNLGQLEILCNNELTMVKRWMVANKRKINPSKSQAITINHKLRSPTSDIQLNYGLNYIQSSEKMKYLGSNRSQTTFFATYNKFRSQII